MIELITIMLVLLGWGFQLRKVIGTLENKKGKKVTLAWFIHNRSDKFWMSIFSALALALIAYIGAEPATLAAKELAAYFSSVFVIGIASSYIAEQLGKKAAPITEDDDDDGKTLLPSRKEIDKLIKDIEDGDKQK